MNPLIKNRGGTIPGSEFIIRANWGVIDSIKANVDSSLQMGRHFWNHPISPYLTLPTHLNHVSHTSDISIFIFFSSIYGTEQRFKIQNFDILVDDTYQLLTYLTCSNLFYIHNEYTINCPMFLNLLPAYILARRSERGMWVCLRWLTLELVGCW